MTDPFTIAAIAVLACYAAATVIHCTRRARNRPRYKVAGLCDRTRGDIDPDWPEVRKTMPGIKEGAA